MCLYQGRQTLIRFPKPRSEQLVNYVMCRNRWAKVIHWIVSIATYSIYERPQIKLSQTKPQKLKTKKSKQRQPVVGKSPKLRILQTSYSFLHFFFIYHCKSEPTKMQAFNATALSGQISDRQKMQTKCIRTEAKRIGSA